MPYLPYRIGRFARANETRSFQPSLSIIAVLRFSGSKSVSREITSRYVIFGRPTERRPCLGFQRISSLTSSFLLRKQWHAKRNRLSRINVEIVGIFPYSCSFVGCCCHEMFRTSCALVSVHAAEPYSKIDSITALKKLRFRSLQRFDFHITCILLSADHALAILILISFSVEEISLPRYTKLSTFFNGFPFAALIIMLLA